MNKNKWFLNGGRGSGRTLRLLCETYENKIAELEKENAELKEELTKKADTNHSLVEQMADLENENAELRKVAEFQQSSNISRHFENKKLKEGLAVGSTFNKALNSLNKTLEEERDKYRNMVFDKDEQLTKAKDIIEKLRALYLSPVVTKEDIKRQDGILNEAERFLSEEEKKYFVYKSGGHYYTIDVKPAYEKVLFEGTDKECYEFVKKELGNV